MRNHWLDGRLRVGDRVIDEAGYVATVVELPEAHRHLVGLAYDTGHVVWKYRDTVKKVTPKDAP